MIDFDEVSVAFDGDRVLHGVDLHIPEGELCLVVGRTGSGKSTLLRAINGHVPHFTGGVLSGRVTVAGRDTRAHRPRDLSDVVGVVGQDPRAGFVTDIVEDELAYGMESMGVAPDVMRKRVEETLDLLGLADLRQRPLRTLSGGQQQRVAIGSVLTAHPQVLVLDEPTSALDPGAADDVLSALHRLVHDLGLTVVLAEHRLERVVHFADRVVHVRSDGRVETGSPQQMLAESPVAPPVIELGRIAGWAPLPLSVRDARRLATPLRQRLATLRPGLADPARAGAAHPGATLAQTKGLTVRRGASLALRDVNLAFVAGQIVAVMGRNGAGKSTLLSGLVGLLSPTAGRVLLGGTAPSELSAPDLRQRVGLVPQDPADLLLAETVAKECRAGDEEADRPAGTTASTLESLAPGIDPGGHPRELSEGQQLALALALTLTADPPLLLLDEPTRGLDYPTKRRLVDVLRQRAERGAAVVLATHDVELVAELADRVIVLADGDVVADGPTADVVVSSPAFAPQVAKIMAPDPWLTVTEVAAALAEAG